MYLIDFRCRPPTKEYQTYFTRKKVSSSHSRYMEAPRIPRSYEESSVELFLKEAEELGIKKMVATGRIIESCQIPNEHLAYLQKKYPDNIIALGGIDPANQFHNALDEVDRCAHEYGMKGINMEPGRSKLKMYVDDRRIYPIYEKCQRLGLIVSLMSSYLAGDDISYTDPVRFQRVARDFPELKIVPGHGCWPFVTQIIAVAQNHKNVYISPDCYFYAPGSEPYVQAANVTCKDQVLFGTAFPLRPLDWSIEMYNKLPLTDEARYKVSYLNAARLLGIE